MTKRTPKTIGERVKLARETRKLGSRALDRAAGLTVGHVAVIEGRGAETIDSSTATKLAGALRVSLDWLLLGQGDGPRAEGAA